MEDEKLNIFEEGSNTGPQFVQSSEEMPTIIKVIGVGGGGNNAVNHMYNKQIKGVSFVVCNTDRQALNNSPVPTRVLIGPNTTKGLGAGNKPEIAKAAAEESQEEIAKLFDDSTSMVFVTAGMGGGTGTGAAPVVAKIAKEKGMLTIGIVTIPFFFEGESKILKALKGADEMKQYVDAIMIINNERLTEIYGELDFLNAFGKADDTLLIAAQSISEIITSEARINLDFNDVNTTLHDGGVAIISSGYGEGEKRVTTAINDALNSPLLKNRDIYGAKRILFNIYFSRQANVAFATSEIDELRLFMSKFSRDVDVIWGVAFDDTLGDKIKITVLASGFDVTLSDEKPQHKVTDQHKTVTTKQKDKEKEKETQLTLKPEENPADIDRDLLIAEYGADKVNSTDQIRARIRYKVLNPDEFDDDEVIREIEKTPTLLRDNKSIGKAIESGAIPKVISSDKAESKTTTGARNGKITFE